MDIFEGFIYFVCTNIAQKIFGPVDILLDYHSIDYHSTSSLKISTVSSPKRNIEDGIINKCTSFEALTALMWRARTAVLQLNPDQQCKLLIIVDGRQRLIPPLAKGYFGNGTVLTSAITTSEKLLANPLSYAIGLVQGATKKVTDEYIQSSIDYYETTRAHPTLAATLVISTWSRLAFHDTDFGWGQPTAAGPGTLPEMEVILFLVHANEHRTMNVVVGLPSSAMVKFQELIQELKCKIQLCVNWQACLFFSLFFLFF